VKGNVEQVVTVANLTITLSLIWRGMLTLAITLLALAREPALRGRAIKSHPSSKTRPPILARFILQLGSSDHCYFFSTK
jgi:hypothetical protein